MKVKFEIIDQSQEGLIGNLRDWWKSRKLNVFKDLDVQELRQNILKMSESQKDELLETYTGVSVGNEFINHDWIKKYLEMHDKALSMFIARSKPIFQRAAKFTPSDVINKSQGFIKFTDAVRSEAAVLDRKIGKLVHPNGVRLESISDWPLKKQGFTTTNIIDIVKLVESWQDKKYFDYLESVNKSFEKLVVQIYRKEHPSDKSKSDSQILKPFYEGTGEIVSCVSFAYKALLEAGYPEITTQVSHSGTRKLALRLLVASRRILD